MFPCLFYATCPGQDETGVWQSMKPLSGVGNKLSRLLTKIRRIGLCISHRKELLKRILEHRVHVEQPDHLLEEKRRNVPISDIRMKKMEPVPVSDIRMRKNFVPKYAIPAEDIVPKYTIPTEDFNSGSGIFSASLSCSACAKLSACF